MPEYIERDTVIAWLKKTGKFLKCMESHKSLCHTIGAIINHIEGTPAADVETVRYGQWVQDGGFDEDDNVYTCSACGEPWTLEAGTPEDNNMHYCPNCGAKMDKEATE